MTEHTSSYYAASANKYAPFDTLNESISCDVCVVGGGYTGLSSALHLAEAGFDVVVLEASRIGFGASGRNGGRVYELSAVTQIQHTTPAVVRTAKGQVTAKYVIVAGNAYLGDKVEPELAKRSMPCGTQVITTERLSEDLARSLIPKNYCVEDCNYLLDYYRLTADNRLLYGGGVVYGARDPDDVERLVVPKLLKTFPQLKGVKIDYRWTDNFLLTLSRMPQFGRLDTNIYYMQGYSGHGVTCTHLAGRLIAELLRGDAERFDAFANLPHYPFPGGRTLRVPFTAMGAAYYSLRDRLGV
ncbi:FAD-binding oxidoreductase [Escherichia coli]|uniref:NAD(P)/FAD-dependent oxidoreductase n=1 Tax=Escherichia coli TaxID=562 RepID=UPI000D129871|nr:FAD-binding oxidoreductase [Escherichia coli]EFJ7418730.1 FAD-binding oxidoreductase [Escherichia coli]EFK6168488.1 FAD-binding oxidoreductase [Escherichia coli]EFL7570798.1 FAD-binding oxidoreductase [Escherichia coli]EGY8803941.1 FAD-binding oxidoreductase [Escherichia coli]EGZ1042653.1 FAD-binding oxidoreductase [Escherichia coli]